MRARHNGPGSDVRVAFVGAGSMANRVHYPSLASLPGVRLAAACDIDQHKLQATADRYGIPGRYADYRKMVEETAPDAVYAVGPPHLMYDIWVWCLEHGLNLFIEKPMGTTLHQARVLANLAERHGCITQVGFQRRSAPLLVRMHEECCRKGPLTHAVCEFAKYAPAPMVGALDHMLNDCVHAIDTLRWMCAGEVAGIESHCRRIGVPDINWISATLHFSSGSVGFLLGNWTAGRRVFRVQMHAHGVSCDADPEDRAWLYTDGGAEPTVYDAKEVAGSQELCVYGGFLAKHREFVESVRSGEEKTSSSFRDAVKTMEVGFKILAQAALKGA